MIVPLQSMWVLIVSIVNSGRDPNVSDYIHTRNWVQTLLLYLVNGSTVSVSTIIRIIIRDRTSINGVVNVVLI